MANDFSRRKNSTFLEETKNKVILFPQLNIRNTCSSDYPQEIDNTLPNSEYENFTDDYLYNKMGWDKSFNWVKNKHKQIKIEIKIL